MTNRNRISWIDTCKGIAIVLVILGHSFLGTGIALAIKEIIYGFHMPLFFILSGYLFSSSPQKIFGNKGFIKKRVTTLMIPYLVYSLILGGFNLILDVLKGREIYLQEIILGIILQSRSSGHTGVVWFLTWMFVTQLVMQGVLNVCGGINKKSMITVATLSIISSLYMLNRGIWLPWYLDAALVSLFFLYTGMLYRKYEVTIDNFLNSVRTILILTLTYLIVLSYNSKILHFDYIEIYESRIGNPILYLIGGILGSFALIGAVKFAHCNFVNRLSCVGMHSLTIYGLHTIVITIVYQILLKTIQIDGVWFLEIARAVLCVILSLFIILPFASFVEKHTPLLFGYKKRIE